MTAAHASMLVLVMGFILAQAVSLSVLWLIAVVLLPIH